MSVSTTLTRVGLEQAFNYLYKDPEKNLRNIMDWADKFANGEFERQRATIRAAIEGPKHPYHDYILHGGHGLTLNLRFFDIYYIIL